MPYSLADRVYVEVYFNGQEFPFNEVNTLDYIHFIESTRLQLPQLTMSLKDPIRWLMQTGSLGDGSLIRLVYGTTADTSSLATVDFRLVRQSKPAGPGTDTIIIEAILDAPRYMAATLREPITGTSSKVLEQLAQTSGLTFEGVGTSDSQVWYPGNRKINAMVRYVAERGFATENSCMLVAVDASKRMIYRDITSMDSPKVNFGLMDLSGASGIPVTSFVPSTHSGVENIRIGYAGAVVEQNVSADSSLNVKHSAVGTVINEQGSLMVNGELKTLVPEGWVRFSPMSPGNVHQNSESARYQNTRVPSLFSSVLELVSPVKTDVTLLDTVGVATSVVEQNDPSAVAWSGSYRVSTKVTYITAGSYAERFTLQRRTVNADLPSSSTTQADAVQRSETLAAPVSSTVDLPHVDFGSFATTLVGASAASITSSMGSVASSATSSVSGLTSALDSAPDFQGLLTSLTSSLNAIVASATADINASLASDPTDSSGAAAAIAASAVSSVNSTVSAQSSAITQAASAAASVSSSVSNVSGSLSSGLTAIYNKLNSVGTEIAGALSKLTPPSSVSAVSSAGASASAAVTSSVSSASSSVNSAMSSVTSAASSMNAAATAAPAQIASAQAAAIAAINALLP